MTDKNSLDFRTIFDKSQVMMHYADMNNIIIAVNEYWLNKMEYTSEEVIGKFSAVFLTKESQDYILKHFTDLFQDQTVNDVEVQAVTKSGKIIDLIFGAHVVFGPDGKPQGFMATSLDVTTQKQTQKALKTREIYLTAIIENQPGLVWLKNAKNQFLAVNQMFAHSCGKTCPEDLIGKTDLDIWPKELAEKYRADDAKLMENRVPIKIEEVIMDEGQRRWFETYKTSVENNEGDIIGTTGYAHDITDRKLREEALHNMQKLESLGILAGGIAHDFNNLLSGIFNSIDIALLLSKDDEVKDVLSNAKKVIHRSRGLTQQLLTFAKGGAPIKKVESLPSFIKETVQFALSGSNVICNFDIHEDLWSCEIDKGQIGQVIDNIVINAQQSISKGGKIIILAENVSIEENNSILKSGCYVKISITNYGPEIPPEILPKIFDPFFTTKPEGNGLGLATSHSIVKRHGGIIEVKSDKENGTTFTIYLPAHCDNYQIAEETVQTSIVKGGTIIIMDDEEVVLDTLKRLLELMGYSVLSSKNGKETLSIFQNQMKEKNEISAMLIDLTVPGGVGGLDIIDEIRKIDSQLPVFVASGYADNPVMSDPEKYGFTGSICKPFILKELSEILQVNK